MRKLHRRAIAPESEAVLAVLQKTVGAATRPAETAGRLWKAQRASQKRSRAFADIRSTLASMASGRKRCMYCEDNAGTDIDHFRPKATHPDRAFSWENYLLACSHCNSNEKRQQFPLDAAGNALLVDPVIDEPTEHLVLVPETGRLVPMTERGTATEKVFGLNRNEVLESGRRDAWAHLLKIVREIGAAHARNDRETVDREIGLARRLSFQCVVHHLVTESLRQGSTLVPPDVAAIVRRTRSDWSWAL
jgi:uncharacterized protein (TIGR02646 family)